MQLPLISQERVFAQACLVFFIGLDRNAWSVALTKKMARLQKQYTAVSRYPTRLLA